MENRGKAVHSLKLPGDWVVSVASGPCENATGYVGVEIDTILLCRKISANVFQQTVVDLRERTGIGI